MLLALASNRSARAWWIWVPLLVLTAGEAVLRPLLEFIPSSVFSIFCLAFSSLAFGMAGLWLLAAHLHHRLRFVVFLKMLGVVAGISTLAFLVRAEWDAPMEAVGFLVFLGICVLIAVAGLSLAGWVGRERYRPIALSLWLVIMLTALWVLIISPLFLLATAAGSGGDWFELASALLAFVGLTSAVLLSFLVLAFANGLYRERLKTLLHLSEACPTPPTISPRPDLEVVPEIQRS